MIDDDHKFVDCALIQGVYRRVGYSHCRDPLARCDMVILDEEIAIAVKQRLVFGQALLALPIVDCRLELA